MHELSAISRPHPGLNAAALHLLAMGLMLVDHLWFVGILESPWWNAAGRLAFPLFAYQISEGYHHTRDFRRYARRLLLFAVLAELPFNLMCSGSLFFPERQNVMVTLLLGLWAAALSNRAREAGSRQQPSPLPGLLLLFLLSILLAPDYGCMGVATVLLFEVSRTMPHPKLWQLAGMILIHGYGLGGPPLTIPVGSLTLRVPIQSFAVLALLPIWLSNGEKGPGGPVFRAFCYSFYPLHMLLLSFFR